MDLHALTAFVCVAEAESFSAAGEHLHLTQPAISKRIANLEEQLNCRLFDRISRQVTLTESGRALLPRAKQILLDIEDTRRTLANLSSKISGSLTIATSHHIGLHRLPPLLKQFCHQYPEVELRLDFAESESAYDQVLQGQLELGVITLSPNPHPQLTATTLWTDQLQFVSAPDHPLAQAKTPRLSDLTRYSAILPGSNTFTRKIVAERFAKQGLSLDVVMPTNYLDTIHMMVSIGLGWSLLPESMIDDRVTILRLNEPAPTRQLGLITHRDRTLSNAARAFIQLLPKHLDSKEASSTGDS